MPYGPGLMAQALCMPYGSCLMAHALWLMPDALCLMAYASYPMACGLWPVAYGLWPMAYSLLAWYGGPTSLVLFLPRTSIVDSLLSVPAGLCLGRRGEISLDTRANHSAEHLKIIDTTI